MSSLFRRSLILSAAIFIVGLSTACGSGGASEPTADGPLVGDAARGQQRFTREGCSNCHSTGSDRVVGPGLAGIGDRGDDAYIRESITDADATIVDGYSNLMADFSRLNRQTVEDLIAYLKTLK